MKEAIYVKMERPDFNQLSLSGSYSAVLSYPAASAQFTASVQRLPQDFTSLMGCDEGERQGISSISSQRGVNEGSEQTNMSQLRENKLH